MDKYTWTALIVYKDSKQGQRIVTHSFNFFDEFEYFITEEDLFRNILQIDITYNYRA